MDMSVAVSDRSSRKLGGTGKGKGRSEAAAVLLAKVCSLLA